VCFIIFFFLDYELIGGGKARDIVLRSKGVERTRELAQAYADKAKEALQVLPESEAKEALGALADRVMNRKS